ncbi:18308_t:CDS:2, partial [Rhizophagus irregularis]
VARLKAIKAINDVEDIKIFDDDFFSDELIDSNHPINARTERVPEGPRISVQVNEQSCREVELGFRVGA